ncbi:MAG: hypothetical protein SFV19_12120 [Rhodospirillaceae bacterium]|nr:hypothetical protein [Rhodospirillaceae bacterium]
MVQLPKATASAMAEATLIIGRFSLRARSGNERTTAVVAIVMNSSPKISREAPTARGRGRRRQNPTRIAYPNGRAIRKTYHKFSREFQGNATPEKLSDYAGFPAPVRGR